MVPRKEYIWIPCCPHSIIAEIPRLVYAQKIQVHIIKVASLPPMTYYAWQINLRFHNPPWNIFLDIVSKQLNLAKTL